MNKILVPLPLLMAFLFLMSFGQVDAQKTVKGTVTDASDGSTLPGVTLAVKGTTVGTITDLDGNYTLIVPEGKDEILVSMVGYASVSQKIGNMSVINFALQTSVQAIDEVVVVGYGTQTRSKVTSSIAKVDMKLMETGMRSNPAQALAGTVSGLRVVTATGRPGAVPALVLRGGTNFDGTGSPLIIMDGQIRGSLSDINPEEIESMEVLKDASATAIYGARASNGVVLITSKKGKVGAATVTVKVKHGTNYLNTPYDFVDAENYIKWARLGAEQAIKNGTLVAGNVAGVGPRGTGNMYKDAAGNILDGNYDSRAIWSVMRLDGVNQELLSQPGWKQMKDVIKTAANGNYDPNGTYYDLIYRDFNYGDYGLNKTAQTQDYNISFTGGNERGKYFSNLGYYDEDGLSLETFYKRLNFAFNGDYKIKDWLTSESGIQFAMAKWKDQSLQNGETNYWARMLSAPPTMRGTNAKGELLLGRDASDGNPAFNVDKYFRGNQSDK
ncbi:MAG: carboxypeptidase-like regulatory domain-containing protein, partial [Prolixibacteraceae bacterium]|nr:carboxypeptidase-like regulatory domain-containing protein [Prolixibacteraceae bacterium]